MSNVERIEGEIKELSTEELATFREWFAKFDSERWDQQLESDIEVGKLDAMAERALRDHEAGRSTGL